MPRILTTREFFEKVQSIHGDKYDYSKVLYLYETDKITITCKKHHIEFQQAVHKHLSGQGCRKCAFEATGDRCRLSAEKFVEKARKIHGDKYNYHGINYTNNNTNIKINCPLHGDFHQTPGNHTHKTRPQGCFECGGRIRWTQDIFIAKVKEIHNEKYSYEKVEFINTVQKITIICPQHGGFSQLPTKHLSGQGCSRCASSFKGTTKSFIKKAIEIHGGKYTYGKVEYTVNHNKIVITCPTHGDFEQTPANHTHKTKPQGCPICSGRYPLNTDDFILRANEKHDFFYDYSKARYVRTTEKVSIICPHHGVFQQQASVHLMGCGCPKCKSSKGEQKIQKVLKDLKVSFEHQYSFQDCRYKQPLPFDFLVIIEDKKYLVEFNGEQHYRVVNFGRTSRSDNSNDVFQEIKVRDQIKEKYANEKEIPLLVLKYDELDEILHKIKNFLKI